MPHLLPRYGPPSPKGKRPLKGWYGVFYDSFRTPRQKEVSLRTRDESTARTRLVEMERQMARGEFDPWTDKPSASGTSAASLTAAEAFERFMRSREASGSAAGIATYRAVIGPFIESLPPGILLPHVALSHVERWLSSRSVRPATLKGYTQRLGIFARWCVAERLAPASWSPVPAPARGKKSRGESAPKYFTEDELAALVELIRARTDAKGAAASGIDCMLPEIVRFTAGTGLRRGEVCALRWENIYLAAGTGSFVRVANTEEFETKSGRERSVPLVGDALSVIRSRVETLGSKPTEGYVFPGVGGGMLAGPYLSKRFRAFVREAGFRANDHQNFHALRHTFGTIAVTRGMDVYKLKEIMGHARIETTLVYAKLRPATLADEMERAFGKG